MTIPCLIGGVLAALLIGCQPPKSNATPQAKPPASHTAGFAWQHAPVADAAACARCHQPDPCARCHATRAPRDHLPGFARRPHAVAAHFDPDRCATCHQAPFCADCH